jgi:DNA-binding transcriptional ArsR family regulator
MPQWRGCKNKKLSNEGTDNYQADPKKIEEWERFSKVIKTAKQRDEQGIIELELSSELQQTGIVERFDFYIKTHAVMLSLNHLYDIKSIICHINTKNWNFTTKTFEQKLKKRGITDQHHIELLSEILDNNYETILGLQIQAQAQESSSDNDYDGDYNESSQSKQKQQQEIIQPLNMSFEQWQATLSQKYKTLYDTVQKNLPHLWPSLEFDLSIKNILHIKDCTLPFAGIVLGRPSSLKTVGIDLLRKSRYIYHTHNFSPKSFVSHATGLTEEQLQKNDLLPQIKNKCLLTPELAPIFASKDDDLVQFMGIVTAILDGHGYGSNSGVHGHRGYDEHMVFTWTGAAVDIPFKVHKLMTTLGPRLYFLRVPSISGKSDKDYYEQIKNNDFQLKVNEIQQALTDYQDYFEACPTMVADDIFNSNIRKMVWILENDKQEQAYMHIVKLGKLLSRLRAVLPTWETKGTQGSDYAYAMPIIEEPDRAMQQLVNLARGHALLTGRNYVKKEDLPMIIRVVLSTAPIERVTIFDVLLAHNGCLTVNQITESLNVSEPTARRTMTELKALGLVYKTRQEIMCSDRIARMMDVITLKEEFSWFLSEQFKELREGFKPESNSDNDDSDDHNGDNVDDSSANSEIQRDRQQTDWNNLLENKAVKEKYPPHIDENNKENQANDKENMHIAKEESTSRHGSYLTEEFSVADSKKITRENDQKNSDNVGLRGGQNSFTSYSTEDSSIINDIDAEIIIPDSIYRLGNSDKFACKNCRLKDDKWGMIRHVQYCKGAGGSQSTKQNREVN